MLEAQLRVAEKLAQQRFSVQLRREKTFPKQLAAAEQLVQEGDLRTGCLILTRLALSRPPSAYSETAKNQLRKLQETARQECQQIDAQLDRADIDSETGPDHIATLLQHYGDLAQKYSGVPVVNKELSKHFARQQSDPKFVVALNESEARRLWSLGQQYEVDSNLCCAHEVYAKASLLVPAATANRASERLRELDRHPALVTSIGNCRKLQTCHEKFQVAETLKDIFPAEADELYRWIISNAPADSRVAIASNDQLTRRTATP